MRPPSIISIGFRKPNLAQLSTQARLSSLANQLTSARDMSTTVQKAPWRDLFLEHTTAMKSPSFTFSTISLSRGTPQPRSRTCIFRGLWTEMPADERNKAPRNPDIYSSDLPLFTTDVRMEKASEIIRSARDVLGDVDASGSGGGGPVEAVWWVEEMGTQWRVRGDGWVVCDSDIDEEGEAARKVRDALQSRMRTQDQEAESKWSWQKEVGVVFGAQSPGIKGSFRGPTPGKLVGEKPEGYEVGMKIDDLDDEIARSNFRVVVIRPFEVEVTDLSDPEKARRQYYTYQEDGSWKHQTLWP